MPGAVEGLTGLQYLAGALGEVVGRLAPLRTNDFNEASYIVKGSLGPKRAHLFSAC
jgi:hypothetical protein